MTPSPPQTPYPLARAREMERLEALLGRCLTLEEKLAYDIGFNTGMEAGLERAKGFVLNYMREVEASQ